MCEQRYFRGVNTVIEDPSSHSSFSRLLLYLYVLLYYNPVIITALLFVV